MEDLEKVLKQGKYSKARRGDLNGKVRGTRRLGADDDDLQITKCLYSEKGDQLLSNPTETEP